MNKFFALVLALAAFAGYQSNTYPPLVGSNYPPLAGSNYPPLAGENYANIKGPEDFPPLAGRNYADIKGPESFPPLAGRNYADIKGPESFPPLAGENYPIRAGVFYPPKVGKIEKSFLVPSFDLGNVKSKYDVCLDKLEPLFHQGVAVARLILDGKWEDSLPLAVRLAESLRDEIHCFEDVLADNKISLAVDPQCVIDQLNKAARVVRLIFDDIRSQDWQSVRRHFQSLVDILKNIKNC